VIAADLDRSGKAEVVVDRGNGLFARGDDGAWRRLRPWPQQGMASGGFD